MKINKEEIQVFLLEDIDIDMNELYYVFNAFLEFPSKENNKMSNLLHYLSCNREKSDYHYSEIDWLWFCFWVEWKNNKDLREELNAKYEEVICDNE